MRNVPYVIIIQGVLIEEVISSQETHLVAVKHKKNVKSLMHNAAQCGPKINNWESKQGL